MYQMTVPLEAQEKDSTCWHAAAFMIWRYSQGQTGRSGPMNTLVNKWVANQALSPQDFIGLAEKVGMLKISNTMHTHTATSLEVLLRIWGPLWCAGFWYGTGHIVVLTGVDTDTVFINDPDGGVRKTGSIHWFNEKLANQVVGCLMAKDPQQY